MEPAASIDRLPSGVVQAASVLGYAPLHRNAGTNMGKGDKKTPKGKRSAGSYGNARARKPTSKTAGAAAVKTTKTATKPVAKPAVKAPAKTVIKKAAPAAK
jgi:ribosomal small subunit protein bTHX